MIARESEVRPTSLTRFFVLGIFSGKIRLLNLWRHTDAAGALLLTCWGDRWADTGSPSVLSVVWRFRRRPRFHAASDMAVIRERCAWPDALPGGFVMPHGDVGC